MVLVWSLIWIPSIYYLDTVQFDIKNTNELISTLTDLFIYLLIIVKKQDAGV